MAKNSKSLKIAVIGRPNVGKSTLVNRLVGRKVCIVGEEAGITRDRKHLDFEWDDRKFTIIDTGGMTFGDEDDFGSRINDQSLAGLNEADAAIFILDVTAGITKYDSEIADLLRKEAKIPVYMAANKVDSPEREQLMYEFYQLGFDKLYAISALHGSVGLSDMLTDIINNLDPEGQAGLVDEEDEIIKVAFVGKPNVGKSSLYNKLIGTDRSIVSDVSGTTRDAINTKVRRHGQEFELIDTAGLRRKTKVRGEVEKYSNVRTTHSIAAADVAVLMLDSTEEEVVSDQDQKIASLIETKGSACVVLLNKWDIFEGKDDITRMDLFNKNLDYQLRFLSYAEKEYISAVSGQRTDKVWQLIKDTYEQYSRRISTSLLNQVLSDIMTLHSPPIVGQKAIKIKYITQVASKPPEFLLFANYPDLIPDSYVRFLQNQLRTYFGFEGTPIRIRFKEQVD